MAFSSPTPPGSISPPPPPAGTRRVRVPIAGGELDLDVPRHLGEPTLIREIAGQDVLRRRLLDAIDRLEHVTGTNRELMLCSKEKLASTTRDFLGVCGELKRFVADLGTYHSAIAPLQEAREDVQTFFSGKIGHEIEELEDMERQLFMEARKELRFRRHELADFRKKLAKSTGMVRTELQKIFAHLFTNDPRNLYRAGGPRSQQEILYRQFRRDVEITEQLYHAVRRLDTYMRGAIVPSDLLQMIADKIEEEGSIGCLFEQDYALFLTALVDEVLEILLPELEEVLHLDGIWYDDFENVEHKSKLLSALCGTFKSFYTDRYGLRREIEKRIAREAMPPDTGVQLIRGVFDTFRHREVAENIREVDQALIDLEGSLLQWEKGVARRAFAREEWRRAEPLQRKPSRPRR